MKTALQKSVAALLLVGTMAVPFSVAHAGLSTPQPLPTLEPSAPIELEKAYNPANSLAQAAQQVSCAKSATGGALAETLEGLAAGLTQELASDALREYGGSYATLGSVLTGLLGDENDSKIEQALKGAAIDAGLDYLSDNAKKIVGALGLADNPRIGSAVAGVLGGGSISDAVGSLFGGDGVGSILGTAIAGPLGGFLGSALGGLFGGGEEQVADEVARQLLQEVLKTTAQTAAQQAALVAKECVLDRIAAQLSNQMLAEASAKILEDYQTGNAGEPRYSQNPASDKRRIADAAALEIIDKLPPNVKAYAYEAHAAQQNTAPAQNANCGQSWDILWFQATKPESCTATTQELQAVSDIQSSIHSNIETYKEQLAQSDGSIPPGVCGNPKNPQASYANCPPAYWKADSPGILATESVIDAAKAGTEIVKRSDEAGESPGSQLLVSLTEALIKEGFDWITEQLFEQGSGSFSGGGGAQGGGTGAQQGSGTFSPGTFLDQITGASSQTTTQEGQTYVSTNIGNAIDIERQYQAVLQQMIDDLGDAKDAYAAVEACYRGVVQNPNAQIQPDVALERANAAKAAADTIFTPQIAQRTALLQSSQNGLSQLIILADEIQSENTVAGVNAVDARYGALLNAGSVHTSSELTILGNDLFTLSTGLSVVQGAATVQLQECRAATTGSSSTQTS